ncbi:chemotaxis protein CheW [Candidatus Woesearchaeota archaeon]|nr:chemotaxis protein CheW [Candidatus Woesearchaeota archaeon]
MLEEKETTKGERQIVVFKIGTEEFGVNISAVGSIIRMEQITRIPNTKPYIKGVINLRGGIIVVIDLAMKLGIERNADDKKTRIIVIELSKNTVGMIVDSTNEVLRLAPNQVEPAPEIITSKINADYIDGVGIVGERLLILLDLAKVLEAGDISTLDSMKGIADKIMANKQENAEADEKPKEQVGESSGGPAETGTSASAGSGNPGPLPNPGAEVKSEEPKSEEVKNDAVNHEGVKN